MWISTSCAGRILRQHLAPISRLTTTFPTSPRATTTNFSSSAAPTSAQLPPEPSIIPSSAPTTPASACNSFTTRTHTCGELGLANVGQSVTICGWLQFQRMRMFLTLRDGYGQTQVIIPDALIDTVQLERIPFESILQVRGRVVPRPAAQQNRRMATGEVEVLCDELCVLNRASTQLPMDVRQHNRAGEQRRLEYRYIDLRFADMQRNLRRRSALLAAMRAWLTDRAGFVEVETPTLFRRTPGGAQEFVVPTRRAGQFYSLVQSPQQFKQMLMAGAVDRYFQVARCYRDESTRPDRQPEFTQLDIELSFTDRAGIQLMIEQLLQHCWSTISDTPPPALPFPRLSYTQAMAEYGCDKPDTRFGLKIRQLQTANRVVHAILVPENTRGKFAPGLPEIVAKAGGCAQPEGAQLHVLQVNREPEAWAKHNRVGELSGDELSTIFGELQVERNNTVLLAFGGGHEEALTALGRARLATMDFLESHNLTATPRSASDFQFLWVVDFPMFAPPSDGSADSPLETVHHPFTAAHPDDTATLLGSDREALLSRCRSQAYDLVLNGQEVGGGSIRIHDAAVQRHVLDTILRIDHRHLAHLLAALGSGCPPHGGIALGVDRLVAILCGAASIRDVIAFPKAADGRDALSKAPVAISAEELRLYHIRVREEKEEEVEKK